jgi:hypothetical protein
VGFCAFSLIIENNAQMASVFAAGLSAPQSLPAIFALRMSNKHSVVRIMTTIAGRVNSHHTFTGKFLQRWAILKYVPKIANPQICGLNFFYRLARSSANVAICGFAICG